MKLDAKSIIHEISASLEKISPVHESEPLIPRYLPGTSNSYLKPSDCHYPRQAALLLVRKWRNHLICSKKGHCYNWIYGYPLGHFMKQCESFTRIFYLRDTPGGEWLPIDPWKKLIDLISSTNITTARFRRERFGRRNSRSREQVKEAVFIFYAGWGGMFMIPSAQKIAFSAAINPYAGSRCSSGDSADDYIGTVSRNRICAVYYFPCFPAQDTLPIY
ncbi:MAG: hypothetical protein HN368_11650 [Spirochaetales bacterium]|nr:hypothetical protein [Spirochaetales bacterium]